MSPTVETARYVQAPKRRGPVRKAVCTVYLVSARDSLTKVGMSNNPVARLNGLRTANADKLALEHSWPVETREQAAALEARLHGLFKWAKRRREWFSVEPRYIRSVGELLLSGNEHGAEALAEELRLATVAHWAHEKAFERRKILSVRWDREEREALAIESDSQMRRHIAHYTAALGAGLIAEEWDRVFTDPPSPSTTR